MKTYKLNDSHSLKIKPMTGNTVSARIHKNGEKMPLYGTHFSLKTSIEDIKHWANSKF